VKRGADFHILTQDTYFIAKPSYLPDGILLDFKSTKVGDIVADR
jgi:hypothetical protein